MKDRADLLSDMWDAVLGEGYWNNMSDQELYKFQQILLDTHQDVLREWTRREMVKRNPHPPLTKNGE